MLVILCQDCLWIPSSVHHIEAGLLQRPLCRIRFVFSTTAKLIFDISRFTYITPLLQYILQLNLVSRVLCITDFTVLHVMAQKYLSVHCILPCVNARLSTLQSASTTAFLSKGALSIPSSLIEHFASLVSPWQNHTQFNDCPEIPFWPEWNLLQDGCNTWSKCGTSTNLFTYQSIRDNANKTKQM